MVTHYMTQNIFKHLVGTQKDRRDQKPNDPKAVSKEYGAAEAKKLGASKFLECSALTQEVCMIILSNTNTVKIMEYRIVPAITIYKVLSYRNCFKLTK